MARPRQKTAFLGEQTVRILLGVPQKQAGWLIHALCDWIENDREPQDGEIPAPCIGAWIAIRDESVRIHDILKTARENGLKGGRPPKKPNETEMKPNGNQTETKKNQEEEEDIDILRTDETADSGAREREEPATAASDQRTAVDIPSKKSSAARAPRFDGDDPDRWEVWARTVHDPVDAALSATGEGANKRPVYGKLLRDLGDKDLFREAVILFAAERRAGDPMRNPAAVLVKKLKQEIADERAEKSRMKEGV